MDVVYITVVLMFIIVLWAMVLTKLSLLGCPCNKKKFLWFTYDGKHDYHVPTCTIEQRGFGLWEYYKVCNKCGNRVHNFGVEQSNMVRIGLVNTDGEPIEQKPQKNKENIDGPSNN